MKANAKDVFIIAVHTRYEEPCDNAVLIPLIHKIYVTVITKSNIKTPSNKLDIDSSDFISAISICENNIALQQVQYLLTNTHNLYICQCMFTLKLWMIKHDTHTNTTNYGIRMTFTF